MRTLNWWWSLMDMFGLDNDAEELAKTLTAIFQVWYTWMEY
jgi:hypothetical protein